MGLGVDQKKLIIILADISGYTRFMLENRTSAVHGQLCINSLIESIVEEVDIPLRLQEIEGDAVFLYAAHPGSDEVWRTVLEEVSRKLATFFEAFIARTGMTIESTPCGCAICRNSDQLGLKIIVHSGEAVFHELAGRPQVSGPDVILAHRLLKNSLASSEYLLLTEAAYQALGDHLPGRFEAREEHYEGFDRVRVRVRFLEQDFLLARDAVYDLDKDQLRSAARGYVKWIRVHAVAAAMQQVRQPIRRFGWFQKMMMIWDAVVRSPILLRYYQRAIPDQQMARGKRRTSWRGREAPVAESAEAITK